MLEESKTNHIPDLYVTFHPVHIQTNPHPKKQPKNPQPELITHIKNNFALYKKAIGENQSVTSRVAVSTITGAAAPDEKPQRGPPQ